MKTSKPRPVSMMVTRTTTFGPVDEPAQAAEAPEPRATVTHQGTTFEVVNRPRMARMNTVDTYRDALTKPPFADAPKVKAKVFDLGQPLFTESHARLIGELRDECARLHAYSSHVRNELNTATKRTAAIDGECRKLRDDVVSLKVKNTQLTVDHYGAMADLKRANDTLAEVESLFTHLRTRGGNRRFSVDQGESDEAESSEIIARPKSPTPDESRTA